MAENQNIEYKESWRKEYLKELCAFANAQGGKLYIGVKDNGDIIGVSERKKLLEDLPNLIQSKLNILANVNALEKDDAQYIEIEVAPSTVPVSYDGRYYFRSGSTTQQLIGPPLTSFLTEKTKYYWDSTITKGKTLDDLDDLSFSIFRREAVRSKRMSEQEVSGSNEDLLQRLDLIKDGELTQAAILLFGKAFGGFAAGKYVKIGYFNERGLLVYQDPLEGSLFRIADQIIDIIYVKYLKAKVTYEKDTRVELYPFPREAVREAIYNALIHNDYTSENPIQIRIEEDAMYVSNECILPFNWTLETLTTAHKSILRNPKIAGAFYRAGYIEAWGQGIQRIYDECLQYGAAPPEYNLLGNSLTVKFTALEKARIPASNRTTVRKDVLKDKDIVIAVLSEIKKNPYRTMSEMAALLGVSYKTVQRAMAELKGNGLVERVGGRKQGYWKTLK